MIFINLYFCILRTVVLNKIKNVFYFPLCIAATGLPVLQYLTMTLSFPATMK